jgi:hypothetical protein
VQTIARRAPCAVPVSKLSGCERHGGILKKGLVFICAVVSALYNTAIRLQVIDVYDDKGNVAECLALLIRRAQMWVVSLGHEAVYKQFLEALDSLNNPNMVHENWGSPANIRAWLTAKGSEQDAAETQFALQYALTGFNDGAGNPAAQAKKKSKELENVLICHYKFTPNRPRNEEVVLSQRVSASYRNLPFAKLCLRVNW